MIITMHTPVSEIPPYGPTAIASCIPQHTKGRLEHSVIASILQLQLVRCAIELWTDLVRPYLKLERGAIANCSPQKIV